MVDETACAVWNPGSCEGTSSCPPRCPRFVAPDGTAYTIYRLGECPTGSRERVAAETGLDPTVDDGLVAFRGDDIVAWTERDRGDGRRWRANVTLGEEASALVGVELVRQIVAAGVDQGAGSVVVRSPADVANGVLGELDGAEAVPDDQDADAIETALRDVVTGEASAREAADRLDIADGKVTAFRRSVADVQDTYDHLADLVGDRSNVVVVSHRSPFNTSFDRHHSKGTREEDREAFHTGSIALKLLARTHDVYATLSGHSHAFGYDTGDGAAAAPYMLNLGYRGLGVVDLDPTAGVFSFVDATAN
jgi:hypothetical protein